MQNPRLIKSSPIPKGSSSSFGRLKAKSSTYQIAIDTPLAEEIKRAILSTSPGIREQKISGKLIIHLHLGGLMALEFTEIEHLKSPQTPLVDVTST